jgi:hypothetical protein
MALNKTVKEIMAEIDKLQKEKDDYALSLETLCSKKNWQNSVATDKRASVINLYHLYTEVKEKIINLLDLKVTI